MDFMREQQIRATRKRHLCNACDKWIEPGETASKFAGVYEGDFQTGYFHPECRVAEIALNDARDYRYGDEWSRLCEDIESEDYSWMRKEHPVAYLRIMMTRDQYANRKATE